MIARSIEETNKHLLYNLCDVCEIPRGRQQTLHELYNKSNVNKLSIVNASISNVLDYTDIARCSVSSETFDAILTSLDYFEADMGEILRLIPDQRVLSTNDCLACPNCYTLPVYLAINTGHPGLLRKNM